MKVCGKAKRNQDNGQHERDSIPLLPDRPLGLGDRGGGSLGIHEERKLLETSGHPVLLLLQEVAAQHFSFIQMEMPAIDAQEPGDEFVFGEKIEIVFFQGNQKGKANAGGPREFLPGDIPSFPLGL